jgi:hypothetical protein
MVPGHDPAQGADGIGLDTVVHGQVRVIPVGENTEALEIGALTFDLLCRVRPAGGAEGGRFHVLARLPEVLFDLQLDRQPVTVPAGNERRIEAGTTSDS